MKNHILFLCFLLGILLTSCIPTKKLIYLQENKEVNNDSIIGQINKKPYRLQVNDLLNIKIKAIEPKLVEVFSSGTQSNIGSEQSDYYNGYIVDDHGNIRLPILGELNVLGFTTEEVRVRIEKLLHDNFFKSEAGVYVTVKLSGFRYTINGEVANTGTKLLFQEKVNIMEAIANAGDITVTGDRKDVKVIRFSTKGTEVFSLDLTDIKSVNLPTFYLQPNDYVYVKPLKQKTWGTGKTGIESLSTLITLLSLATTTYLLLKR